MSYSEMGEVWEEYVRVRCANAVEHLAKRDFDARFYATRTEAVQAVLDTIPTDAAVGCGGSWTMRQIGLLEALKERGNQVFAHDQGMDFVEAMRVRREALLSPFYLSSSNAITMRGELVNTDGMGNRVAGLSFGPGTVIIVAGYNKLVADLDAAFERIREVAAPANAIRYKADAPCVEKGRCYDCTKPSSICRITTIIRQKPIITDYKVFLVGESLGF
jgi:LUD domain